MPDLCQRTQYGRGISVRIFAPRTMKRPLCKNSRLRFIYRDLPNGLSISASLLQLMAGCRNDKKPFNWEIPLSLQLLPLNFWEDSLCFPIPNQFPGAWARGFSCVFNSSRKDRNVQESWWDHLHLVCCPLPNIYLIQQLVKLSPHSSEGGSCCFQISVWAKRLTLRMSVKMFGPVRVWKRETNVLSLPLQSWESTYNLVLGPIFFSCILVITVLDYLWAQWPYSLAATGSFFH